MIVEVKNGKNYLKIGLKWGIGSYFSFTKPLAVSWYDGRGSIAQNLIVAQQDPQYRNLVEEKVVDLYTDFTDDIEGAYNFVKPLLELFEDGKYGIGFSNSENKSAFIYQTSTDNFSKNHIAHWELLIPEATIKENERQVILSHKMYLLKNLFNKDIWKPNIVEFTTYNYYSYSTEFFIATQPFESINNDRVAFYKKEIEAGKRPFAIVVSKDFYSQNQEVDYDCYSENFVLDGHHKLLAYKELNLYPPILSISSLPENVHSVHFDLEELKKVLFSWQFDDIIKDWED